MGAKPSLIPFSMILSLVSVPFGLASKLAWNEEVLGSIHSSEERCEINYLGLDAYFQLRSQFGWDRLFCTTGVLFPNKQTGDPLQENKTGLQFLIASLETVPEKDPESCSSDLSDPFVIAKKINGCEPCRLEGPCCDSSPVLAAPCCEEEPACFRPNAYALAHAGYRRDQLSCTTGILFPNNYEMFDDTLKAQNLQLYEIGGKALFTLGAHWYLRGFYSYGWIFDGRFIDLFLNGKLKGHTQDGMGGIGYCCPVNSWCGLGVVGGWSFNQQEPILKNANVSQFNDLRFQSIWNGPWLGVDFFARGYQWLNVALGYEFHLASWRGSWLLEQELENAFSDQRKGGLSFGQVVYADFRFDLSKRWSIDFEFKYQNWSTQGAGFVNSSGNVPFNSSPISGPVSAITFVKEATWESIGGSFNLGYHY